MKLSFALLLVLSLVGPIRPTELGEADSKLILEIVSPLRVFRTGHDDSSLVADDKSRRLSAAIVGVGRTWRGRLVTLYGADVSDVYEVQGEFQVAYFAIVKAGDSDVMVRVVRHLASRAEALKVRRGPAVVSGRVLSLAYDATASNETLTISVK